MGLSKGLKHAVLRNLKKLVERRDKIQAQLKILSTELASVTSDIAALEKVSDVSSRDVHTRRLHTFSALSKEGIALGAQLPETFNVRDVSPLLPPEIGSNANSFVYNWKKKGWVECVSRGVYRKTSVFGQLAQLS